jgi:hypothetical protein
VALPEAVKHLAPRNDGAQWHPAPKRLAEEDDIRLNVPVLVRKHPSRAGESDFDLIDREQDAVAIAEGPQLRHEVRRWHDITAVTLHRFHEDGRNVTRLANRAEQVVLQVVQTLVGEILRRAEEGWVVRIGVRRFDDVRSANHSRQRRVRR